MSKIGRNKLCTCGSGNKSKKCCGTGSVGYVNHLAFAELYNRGNSLADQGRVDEAIHCYVRALEINPSFAGTYNNLGIAFKCQGMLDKAISCYQRALVIEPAFVGAYNNLGIALKEEGRYEEAVACYRKALAIAPDSVQVYNNLGNILDDLGELHEAITCFQKVLEIAPDFSTYWKLGNALLGSGRYDEAVACYQQALMIMPESALVLNKMAAAYICQGRHDEAISCYRRALSADPDHANAYSGLLMTQQYAFSITNEASYVEAQQFARKFEHPLQEGWNSVARALQPGNRLKVGLVSADFHNHPVGYFLEGVLRHLSRDSLALFAYANQLAHDSLSDRIMPYFEAWVAVKEMSDYQLADRIQSDGIDLLIDLSGHTDGNRLLAFARRPAPVQATWLGYANTTGLRRMDFILADPITIPTEEEKFYTEKVWRLPETYLCFTPPDVDVPTAGLPALANGHVTFGCFNNPAKLNDTVISSWADILRVVPDSVLLLKYKNFEHEPERDAFRQRFRKVGIDSTRLSFAGASSRDEYLAAYREVDFCLDPFPFPGLTTTCEALWMGVPTLTLRVPRGLYGHNGELVMKSVGLDDWVAESVEEYRERAQALAANLEWLAVLRVRLRQALLSSPLCAAERFARNLENAFRGMVRMSAAVKQAHNPPYELQLHTGIEATEPHNIQVT